MVALLRRGPLSVEELAVSLGLTDNAVRAQLAALERERIAQPAGIRRDGKVGKPATLYGIAPENSALFSNAYAPLLAALLSELGRSLTAKQVESILKRAGASLAAAVPAKTKFDERVRSGAAFLTALGADADLVQTNEGYELRGHGCVLGEAVVACPATCGVLEELLRAVTGGRVVERCDRTGPPECRFAITPLVESGADSRGRRR